MQPQDGSPEEEDAAAVASASSHLLSFAGIDLMENDDDDIYQSTDDDIEDEGMGAAEKEASPAEEAADDDQAKPTRTAGARSKKRRLRDWDAKETQELISILEEKDVGNNGLSQDEWDRIGKEIGRSGVSCYSKYGKLRKQGYFQQAADDTSA